MKLVSTQASGARVELLPDRVIKTHAAGTDPVLLGRRLQLAATHPAFVPPLRTQVGRSGDGRSVTEWPRVAVAAPDDAALPWAEAGRLLAGLHLSPPPSDLPRHTWVDRLARARVRAPVELAALGAALSAELAERTEPGVLVHGDWHLGQLGRWSDGWRLIDIDDVGLGDPAWDLARPAGFWAAGLLDDAAWQRFLDAYRNAGGPAVPAAADPWPVLDLPARVAVFVAAARAADGPDPDRALTADALAEACRRMAQ